MIVDSLFNLDSKIKQSPNSACTTCSFITALFCNSSIKVKQSNAETLEKRMEIYSPLETGRSSLFPHSPHEPRYIFTFSYPNNFNAKKAFAALYPP